MDIRLTLYRYNQIIDRANMTIRLTITICTLWIAVFIFLLKINIIPVGGVNAQRLDFNWDIFIFVCVIAFCMLSSAFYCGFGAIDTEKRSDGKLISNYLLSTDQKYSLTLTTCRRLNEITSEKESLNAKAMVFNLISCMTAFGSFVVGFFSIEEILSNVKFMTYFFGIVLSAIFFLIVYNVDSIRKFLGFDKK